MAAAGRLLEAAVPFVPATYDGLFVVTAADRVAEVLAHPLDRALTDLAPRARLHPRTLTGPPGPASDVDRGLYVVPDIAHGLLAEPLFNESYAVVVRACHPLLDGPWTAERYAAADHLLVAPRGDSARGAVDTALAPLGLTRRVSRVVSSFRIAVALAETSDRIVTLPSSFVVSTAGTYVVRPPPLPLPPIRMQVAWHPRQQGDPRYEWLRRVLHAAVGIAGLGREP